MHFFLFTIYVYINYNYLCIFNSFLNLGPPLPELDIDDMLDSEKRQQLIHVLDQRIKKKDELREVLINQSMVLVFNIEYRNIMN